MPSNPGLGDALQGAEGILFLAEDDEAFLNSVHEQGLAELEPGNVAMQIGRIFRARRARLPSCRCWSRQVLLRSQIGVAGEPPPPNLWALTGGTRLIPPNYT